MTRDGGKGAAPRPLGVPMDQFDKNFEAIFGKKEPIPFAGMVDIEPTEEEINERNRNS